MVEATLDTDGENRSYRGRIVSAPASDEAMSQSIGTPVASDAGRIARAEAAAILMQAREKARAITEAAEAEAVERANDIEARAIRDAEELIAARFLAARQVIHAEFRAIEPRLSALVFETVRKMVGSMAKEDVARGLVSRGLSGLREQAGVVILVHEDDYDIMMSAVGQLSDHQRTAIKAVEIEPLLEVGECRLKTQDVVLDVSVETQLRALARDLVPNTSAAALKPVPEADA